MSDGQVQDAHRAARIARRANIVSALIWLGIGAFLALQAQTLPYMSRFGPGPGFLLVWLSVGFGILGLLLLLKAVFRPAAGGDLTLPDGRSAIQMFLIMAGFFAFVFFTDSLGFLPGVGLLTFFLLWVVERKGWLFSLVVALLVGLAFWAVFDKALQMWLPKGILEYL
jgi:hypothetical protein